MSENNLSKSEINALIEVIFRSYDALLSCEILENVSSFLKMKLVKHLSESYKIANDMLLSNDYPPNELHSPATIQVAKRRLRQK